jgi:hypothetical protein
VEREVRRGVGTRTLPDVLAGRVGKGFGGCSVARRVPSSRVSGGRLRRYCKKTPIAYPHYGGVHGGGCANYVRCFDPEYISIGENHHSDMQVKAFLPLR